MKKAKSFLSVLACLVFLSSFGYSNGLNLNGLGARAVAMGGAFVGLADDFSAIFWNPAGLAQLKGTTFGLCGDAILPKGTYELSLLGIDAQTQSTMYPAGVLGFFVPIGENVVAGVGVYTPSGLGAKWDGADMALLAGTPDTPNADIIWESFIGVVSASPSLAVNIQDMFYLGASLNINYGMFNIKRTAGYATVNVPVSTPIGIIYVPIFIDLGQYEESSTGWGFGATIGALIKPIEQLSFGISYRTPSKVKFSGDASIENFPTLGIPQETTFDREVTSPMWLGIGVAIHPFENFTITADAQYTNWKKLDVVHTTFDDTNWAFLLADESDMELHWADKWQFRFGLEYWISEAFALRSGYYYDPAPSPDATMNILVPNYDFNSVSFGFGYLLNGLQIDLTAEYLMGKERVVALSLENEMPGVYNMNILALTISLIYTWFN
ncbi:MAG: outer membrane protein transport protein [Candidatus Aminicenantes bacterium]|jgi:long-chain fatty acid transport protein